MTRLTIILPFVCCILINVCSCTSGKRDNNKAAIEWIKCSDPDTGYDVWQITHHDSISDAFYFYANSFTSDDHYLIFRSKRSGIWDVYRCDLQNGEIIQLTFEGVNSACIHPDGQSLIYISGWKFYKMDVHTLEKEIVMDFTGKLPAEPEFRPSITNDGQYTIVCTRLNNIICIFRIDLKAKEVLKVFEKDSGNFSHQLINPVNPDLITYVPLPDKQNDMNLPMSERARTRIIRVDKGTDEPFLVTPYGYRATHDSWSPLGDRLFFFEKTQPRWLPVSIASIDLNGADYTRHYTSNEIKLGHGAISKDGKWFITDGQDPFKNPLILINLQDGRAKTLCWPNASIDSPARVHVHPNFSFSGNYIIYTSDIEKKDLPQVYIVPIKEIKETW